MKRSFLFRTLQCIAGNVETFARPGSRTTSPHVSMMMRARGVVGMFATTVEFTPAEARVQAQHLLDGADIADGKEVS